MIAWKKLFEHLVADEDNEHAMIDSTIVRAHQLSVDDDINVFGPALAWDLIETFLTTHFSGALRHQRRVDKVHALENLGVGA